MIDAEVIVAIVMCVSMFWLGKLVERKEAYDTRSQDRSQDDSQDDSQACRSPEAQCLGDDVDAPNRKYCYWGAQKSTYGTCCTDPKSTDCKPPLTQSAACRGSDPPECGQGGEAVCGPDGTWACSERLDSLAVALLDAAIRAFPKQRWPLDAKKLVKMVHRVVAAKKAGPVSNGRISYRTGNVYVTHNKPGGSAYSPAFIRNALIHELAHAASRWDGNNHGPVWRARYIDLLRLATEELGWKVSPGCNACPRYKLCGSDCPKCEVECPTR